MTDGNDGKAHRDENTGDDLTEFSARLSAKQKAHHRSEHAPSRGSAIGMAFRLSTEMVAGLVVGGGMGWLLDRWLGTAPWFLLVFFVLGMAAGILNVFRTARELSAQAARQAEEDDG